MRRKRENFQQETQQTDAYRLIFFDEFGTNLGMTRRYGYAPEGARAYVRLSISFQSKSADDHLTRAV